MKRYVFLGVLAVLAALGGCAAQQQREVNAAYVASNESKAQAAIACATSADVTGCGLMLAAIYGGGASQGVPVVQSDLSAVLNSSALGAGVNMLGQVQQAKYAANVAIAQTNASAASQTALYSTFGGIVQSNASVAIATQQSTASMATAGFQALVGTAGHGFDAAQAIAASSNLGIMSLAEIMGNAKPTYQVGGDMVTGDGNRTRGSGDVTTTTTVTCNATGTGASAAGSGGNGGATGQGGSTIPSGGDGSASNGCR